MGFHVEPQARRILNYMRKGNGITALEALNRFGCNRLAARICELRKFNDITTERVTVKTREGKAVIARYWLDEPAPYYG